mmetsp:Transcript_5387/g.10055  ORF Transcript_5387/g.10055 Transcript_5387/m.10055 type:complete len:229 (-) Transcript_5387:2036-2722(-)
MEWKKASPKRSLRNASSFTQPLKKSGLLMGSLKYVRRRPARRPLGASFVILMPFSRMVMGKIGEGYDVSHRRKSLCTFPSTNCCSTTSSKVGKNDLAKWQFWRTTQKPSAAPKSIHFWATGPWPCPRLTLSTRRPRSSANLRSGVIGSDPGDSTNTKGVTEFESLNDGSMEKGVGSTKRFPNACETKAVKAGRILSGRMVLNTTIRSNTSSVLLQGSGSGSACGSNES